MNRRHFFGLIAAAAVTPLVKVLPKPKSSRVKAILAGVLKQLRLEEPITLDTPLTLRSGWGIASGPIGFTPSEYVFTVPAGATSWISRDEILRFPLPATETV